MTQITTAQPPTAPPDRLVRHGAQIESAAADDSETAFVYLDTAIVVPNVKGQSDREVETVAAVRLGEMLVNGQDLEFRVEVE